jgi:hypothetical protein
MPDPVTDAFIKQYSGLGTPEEREELAREFVSQIEANSPNYIAATEYVVRAGTAVDRDFTKFLSRFQSQDVPPPTLEDVQNAVKDARGQASWLNRTKARTLTSLDWYQRNITEPAAANVVNFALESIPGEQQLEQNIREAMQAAAATKGLDANSLTLAERNQAIGDAWRKTNMSWGLKGSAEVLFDPLNLVGLGIPGKIITRVPELRPLLAPLQAVDQLPDAAVRKALTIPGNFAKQVPGVRRLLETSQGTRMLALRNNIEAEVRSAFDSASLLSNDVTATGEVLSNLTRYPLDANRYSLRNVMGHLEESMNASLKTTRREVDGVVEEILPYEDFVEKLNTATPEQAAQLIAGAAVQQERKVVRAGGKSLTGDVITEEASKVGQVAARKKAVGDLSQKLALDQKWGRAIGEAAHDAINSIWSTYTRKIEPTILRPWTLTHLVSVGYLPFNLVEDVGYAVVGMGTIPHGLAGEQIRLMSQGLVGDAAPPKFLNVAGSPEQLGIDQLALGQFEIGSRMDDSATGFIRQFGIKQAGEMGIHLQKESWGRKYLQHFDKAMAERGVTKNEINAFRSYIDNEIPTNLGMSAEEISLATWTAATGGPDAIRQLKGVFTVERMLRKSQHAVLAEFPELLPDIRRAIRRSIDANGGITADNVEDIMRTASDEVVKWHRFTEEGLERHYGDTINAIGQAPPKSGSEAMSMMRSMQWAADGLKSLPREMSARFAAEAAALPPAQRAAVWQRMREEIPARLQSLSEKYDEMVRRAQPLIDSALEADDKFRAGVSTPARQSLKAANKTYFDLQGQMVKRARDAAEEVNTLSQRMFADTPDELRNSAFWDEYRREVSSIWDSQYEDAMQMQQDATDAWSGIFNIAKPNQLNPKEQDFMLKGLEAALGEAHQRRDEVIHILTRLEEKLTTASPSAEGILKNRIETLKTRAIINEDKIRQLLSRREDFVSVGRRTVNTSRMAEINKGLSAQRKTIKLLEEKGAVELLPSARETLRLAEAERRKMLRELLPVDLRRQYDALQSSIDEINPRLEAPGLSDRNRKSLEAQQRKLQSQLKRFEDSIARGETSRDLGQIGTVTLRAQQEAALAALRANGNVLPATLEDMEDLLLRLADEGGDPSLQPLVEQLADNVESAEEVLQRVYAEAAKFSSVDAIPAQQFETLKSVYDNGEVGIFPTRHLVELSEQGLIEPFKAVPGTGRVQTRLTEEGQRIMEVQPTSNIQLSEIEASANPFDTSVEHMLVQTQSAVSRMVELADNPPLTGAGSDSASRFFERTAREMERRTEFAANIEEAKQVAGRRANVDFRENFTNYDFRTTGDLIMTHVMPFWMYASRKWPRMVRLAGKRPILGKYMAQISLDHEYGWVPTPWGDDFSPFKGTMIGGWRRASYRDFPERSQGFGGFLESGQDWLGRFGFNPNPAITTFTNRLTSEDAASLPPPIQLVAQGIIAAGGDLPGGMDEFFFGSRFLEWQQDQVMAETFKKDPVDIRRLAADGDEDAMAEMQVSRMEAARVAIRTAQTGIFRYRPAGKREFIGTAEEFVRDSLGVDEAYQRQLRALGVPLSTMVPISKFQRKIMREQMGDDRYEAWLNANIALLPLAEQKARRLVDKFWFELAQVDEAQNEAKNVLSDRWEAGLISGVQYRRELSALKREQAYFYEAKKAESEFANLADGIGIPDNKEAIAQWRQHFGTPPPMVHPVDELIQRYNAVDPDTFINGITGEVDWHLYFKARQNILEDAPDPIRSIAESELRQRAETPAERALVVSQDALRRYYGVEDDVVAQMRQFDPELEVAYHMVQQFANLAARTTSQQEKLLFQQRASQLLAQNPQLSLAKAIVRQQRQQLRKTDSEVDMAYQMWIANPQVSSTGGRAPRAGVAAATRAPRLR